MYMYAKSLSISHALSYLYKFNGKHSHFCQQRIVLSKEIKVYETNLYICNIIFASLKGQIKP